MTLRRVGAHQRCIRPSLSDTKDSHLKGKLAAAVSRGGRSLLDNPVLFETVEVPKNVLHYKHLVKMTTSVTHQSVCTNLLNGSRLSLKNYERTVHGPVG